MRRFLFYWTFVFVLSSSVFVLSSSACLADVSVTDFGAVPDDGRDDTAAFQKAVLQGGTVYVPAGTFQLTVSGCPSLFAVVCPKSVQIVGAGRDLTRIVTEPSLTATGNGFLFQAGTQAVLSDLTYQGPTLLNGFYSVGVIHHGGSGGSLSIQRCAIHGGHMAVRMEELNGKQESPQTTVADSILESLTCLHALNSGQCSVVRTRFYGYGVPGSNLHHAIYTYLPVSLYVDNCVFAGNAGLGFDVQVYSPSVPGAGTIDVRNSSFLGFGTRSLLTHAQTRTWIRSCQLNTTVVQVPLGGAVFVGCSLYSANQVQPWPYPPGPGTWQFHNCTFGQ